MTSQHIPPYFLLRSYLVRCPHTLIIPYSLFLLAAQSHSYSSSLRGGLAVVYAVSTIYGQLSLCLLHYIPIFIPTYSIPIPTPSRLLQPVIHVIRYQSQVCRGGHVCSTTTHARPLVREPVSIKDG
ncbi:hypothetical protein F4678DRAFT_138740 [Xylaria arbuscula]|nr:hypothetical protein F4678DRAFT_138740 [Xylaria arbuscula]